MTRVQPGFSATPTPVERSCGSSTFARGAGLSIHIFTITFAVAASHDGIMARFSAIR